MKNNQLTTRYNRESCFDLFLQQELPAFWDKKVEDYFIGKDEVKICYAYYKHPNAQKFILIVTGRLESYLRYRELAYDLFHCGYDIFIYDHRGQGLSGRLLPDPEKGHVQDFNDYVDDLHSFFNKIDSKHYQQRYILAHSMGSTVAALFLAQYKPNITAVTLVSPMIKIRFPFPEIVVKNLVSLIDRCASLSTGYAITTGPWRSIGFNNNPFTHSEIRFYLNQKAYENFREIRLGGPTYHWVYESIKAGCNLMTLAHQIDVPVLILQASEDVIVDNRAQNKFYELLVNAQGNKRIQLLVIEGARHEILIEKDQQRAQVLDNVLNFFAKYG